MQTKEKMASHAKHVRLVKWITGEISKLLGDETGDDMANYMLSMESAEDLEEYLSGLLDCTDVNHRNFISELLAHFNDFKATNNENIPLKNAVPYRKPAQPEEYVSAKAIGRKPKDKAAVTDERKAMTAEQKEEASGKTRKSSSKFVPLYNPEGEMRDVVLLPGRHRCECQAARHGLINNCLSCGRIVCEQEGSGPCFFCSNLVCTKAEEVIIQRGSKKSEQLLKKLTKDMQRPAADPGNATNGLDSAVKHKDRLLEFDRTSAKRTQVIDDESDYFSANNQWLSDEQRKLVAKRQAERDREKQLSRRQRKITLDFAGRRVVEEEDEGRSLSDENAGIGDGLEDKMEKKFLPEMSDSYSLNDDDCLANPAIHQPPPKFMWCGDMLEDMPVVSPRDQGGRIRKNGGGSEKSRMRVQDKGLQEMCDQGVCLSMHQPWASLLITGIKKHEGRTWYTPHRGRLWIAATSKPLKPSDISDVEQFYKSLFKNKIVLFPDTYPSGCLLGYVDVTDCLVEEQYRDEFPDGESSSPFVFVCENPVELQVKFPLKGRHKIWKLDGRIHQAAKKSVQLQQAAAEKMK